MGERETPEAAATTRSQSVVHHTERTPGEAARLVSTLLERGGGEDGLATLVIVPTIDDAIGLAESLVKRGQRGLVPITSQARGRRLLSTGPGAVAATASDLAAFVAESRLTLSTLQALAILWPEEIIDSEQNAALERVLGEVSKSAERLAVVSQRSDELNKFIERTMWRARNIDHVAPAPTSTAAVRVLAAAPVDRLRALRTVLDAYDPPSAVLLTFSEESEAAAHDAAAVLGANGNLVSVRRGVPDESLSLSIIFVGVPGAEELDAAAAGTPPTPASATPPSPPPDQAPRNAMPPRTPREYSSPSSVPRGWQRSTRWRLVPLRSSGPARSAMRAPCMTRCAMRSARSPLPARTSRGFPCSNHCSRDSSRLT